MRKLIAAISLGFIASSWSVSAQTPSTANPSFDVASIKPNLTESTSAIGFKVIRNGRFSVSNLSLQGLIAMAFDVDGRDGVQNLPGWAKTAKYDIEATTSTDAPASVLLRALLEERFRLVAHHGTREIQTYELVLANPDHQLGSGMHPTAIVDCKAPLGPGKERCGTYISGDANRVMRRGLAQPIGNFIKQIDNTVERRVVDKTGLTGLFDWQLQTEWDGTAESIFTALKEQLGLKLQPGQETVDAIVIDHIEPPTPN